MNETLRESRWQDAERQGTTFTIDPHASALDMHNELTLPPRLYLSRIAATALVVSNDLSELGAGSPYDMHSAIIYGVSLDIQQALELVRSIHESWQRGDEAMNGLVVAEDNPRP